MNIEVKPITTEIKSDVKVAIYSSGDIKSLIALDLKSQGYEIELSDVSFNTDWKRVSDEWDMNSRIVTMFNGAEIKLKEEK